METRLKGFLQFINESTNISENLQYHIKHELSITESVFRPGSSAHVSLLKESRSLFDKKKIILSENDKNLFLTTDLGKTGIYAGKEVPLDLVLEDLNEAKYNNAEVKLNYPMRNSGPGKKYYVYVLNKQTGRVKKIMFGDVHGGLTAKVSNSAARKSFAARHQCHKKNNKLAAGYWACRINRYAHLWGGKTYPGYW